MTQEQIARLSRQIAGRPPGPFHLPEVWGPGWEQLDIGARVRSGRDFMELVRRGGFPGVADTGVKRRGGRVYLWSGDRGA